MPNSPVIYLVVGYKSKYPIILFIIITLFTALSQPQKPKESKKIKPKE